MNRSRKHKRGGKGKRQKQPQPPGAKESEAASLPERPFQPPEGEGEGEEDEPPPLEDVGAESAVEGLAHIPTRPAPCAEGEEEEEALYTVEVSDIMGRYLVAKQDIAPAQIIIQEDPIVVGPSQDCKPLCLGCYKLLGEDEAEDYRCERCGWPLCGAGCPGVGAPLGHSAWECEAWEAAGLGRRRPRPPLASRALRLAYFAVVPLRCLLLKSHAPDRWRALTAMEAHDTLRKGLPDLWRSNQALVVDRIRVDWGMAHFAEDQIHTVCGILEVNSFEIGSNGVRSLYPRAFYMAHDCVPNTTHADDERYTLRVRAARPIRQGDAITLSYAYTLQGTMKRREHLLASKFFECVCARCADPTELGTFASALRCPKCVQGHVLSSAPLRKEAAWRCSCCDYAVQAQHVRQLNERINQEMDALDCNDVRGLEALVARYGAVLHPNHYLALSAKHSLAQLYGKIEGYAINELPDALLRRKRDICRELMRVFDVLEPGLTRLRGIILYELHAPIMILATRGFEAKALSKKELAAQLKDVVACLEEASDILALEPETSSEGLMGRAARDALGRMRGWQNVISKM